MKKKFNFEFGFGFMVNFSQKICFTIPTIRLIRHCIQMFWKKNNNCCDTKMPFDFSIYLLLFIIDKIGSPIIIIPPLFSFWGSFMSKNGHFMLDDSRGVFLFFVFIIYSRGWLYNDRKLCQDMITWLFVLQKRLFLGRRIS